MTKSLGTKSWGRKCGRKMSWQKYGLPCGLRWVWINFRMAVTASPAGPYNPRWIGRALGRRNSPRAIARHTQPPEAAVMGAQQRWGEPLETVISAAEFTIHGLTRSQRTVVLDCPAAGAVIGNSTSANTALVSSDNNASLRSAFVGLVMTESANEPSGD